MVMVMVVAIKVSLEHGKQTEKSLLMMVVLMPFGPLSLVARSGPAGAVIIALVIIL
jgi:hypothetical protein